MQKSLEHCIIFLKNIKKKNSEHDQFEKLMIIGDFYIPMMKYEDFYYKKDYVYKSAKINKNCI